jgi:HEXXH motif-containing protein
MVEIPGMSAYRGLASPYDALDFDPLEVLAVDYQRRVVQTLLSRFGTLLEARGDGVTGVLSHWLESPTDFDEIFDSSFGRIGELFTGRRQRLGDFDEQHYGEVLGLPTLVPTRGDDLEVLQRTAGVALRMVECGLPADFSLAIGAATRLHWAGWLLPAADALSVESDAARATIRLRSNGTARVFEFESTDAGWRGSAETLLPTAKFFDRSLQIIPPEWSCPREYLRTRLRDDELPPAVELVEAAGRLLGSHARSHVGWVERVLRRLIPTRTPNDVIVSGTSSHRPGLLYLGWPMPVSVAAELLVHEASHQYFWLASAYGPVEEGSGDEMCFSVYVRQQRNLRTLLMTYHAFANVVLFHRACQAHGLRDAHTDAREAEFSSQLGHYENILSASKYLTPLGKALWEPLAELTHSATPRTVSNSPSPGESHDIEEIHAE